MAPQPRDEAHDACVTISIKWGQMQELRPMQDITPAPCPVQQEIMPIAVKAKPKSKAKGRAKGKHASNATKKTPPTIKRPAGNFKATFPGVPNKPEAPRDIGNNMRLFTDVGSGAWRVKCDGRPNKTFTWKTDPKGAWERLRNYVSAA